MVPESGGDLEGTRALVLGGTGLIGSHVVESVLAHGGAVRVMSRAPEAARTLRGLPVEWVKGRLEDAASLEAALDGIDLLFHAAAPYPSRHFGMRGFVADALRRQRTLLELCRARVPSELLHIALPRTEQVAIEQAEMAAQIVRSQPERASEAAAAVRMPSLVPLAREHRLDAARHPSLAACRHLPGLKRIVYVSSITTIGRPRGTESGEPAHRPARESDRYDLGPDPSPYFACKRLLEAEVVRAVNEGLPAVIVNPSFVVDRGDAHLTSGRLVLPVARGQMPVALRGSLPLVAGTDAGEGTVRAALQGRTGQRYILSHESMRLTAFFQLVAAEAGARPPRVVLPVALVQPLALASELIAWATRAQWALFPMHGLMMLRHAQPVDSSLAVEELGLPRTPLHVAVRRALSWYREEGYLPAR
jgi:dihydroflavonol-4-reductase